jgi:hypothetical protein
VSAPEIRVHHSPSHCPYCKGPLGDPHGIVACAACGARHHRECREEHGRCAACSSREVLVYAADIHAAPPAPPPPGGALELVTEEEARVALYRWALLEKDGLELIPRVGYLRLAPDAISFLAASGRRLFDVHATRPEVGDVLAIGRKLLVDVRRPGGAGKVEHTVATESIGYSLGPRDVATLESALGTWKRR